MNFTQEQISDILFDLANKGGTHLLLNLTLNAFMKAERALHQDENPDEYGNGYRYCKAMAHSKELVLKVPRTRSGLFYPSLLAIIRDEDEERRNFFDSGVDHRRTQIVDPLYGFVSVSLFVFYVNFVFYIFPHSHRQLGT